MDMATYLGGLFVDPLRDRIIISATVPNETGVWGAGLLVVDRSGNLLANTSLPEAGSPFGLDVATGLVYLVSGSYSSTASVHAVDPISGLTVRGPWYYNYNGEVAGFVLGNGSLYMVYQRPLPPRPDYTVLYNLTVVLADALTGAVRRNYSLPDGYVGLWSGGGIVASPSGRWLFGRWYNDSEDRSFRLDLSDGSLVFLEGVGDSYAFSPDGRLVYMCRDPSWIYPAASLYAYWVENASLRLSGYCDGGPMAVNPMTGVVATGASGSLLWNGTAFEYLQVRRYPQLRDIAWTGDGRLLVGLAYTDCGFHCNDVVLGSWGGTPWFVAPYSTVLGPTVGSISLPIRSVSGFNGTTIEVAVDGGSWPFATTGPVLGSVVVNLTQLAEGAHTLRVTGWDLFGEWMDQTMTFEIDRSSPVLRVLSSLVPTAVPYRMYGTADDLTLASVRVNGVAASLDGTNWSAPMDLVIGNNSFRIDAVDAIDLESNLSGVVRYWPLHDDVVMNTTYHVSVADPPGWLASVGSLGNFSLDLVLMEPTNDGAPSYFSVETLPDPQANDTYAYAEKLAQYQADLLETLGGSIEQGVHSDAVDGRPAASFRATVYFGGYSATSVVTLVASADWHLAYLLTMNIPQTRAAANPETRAWIMEGFHIERLATPPPPSHEQYLGLWQPFLVAAAASGATGIAYLVLVRIRRKRQRQPRNR